MSSLAKSKLKASREAIQAKDWLSASDAASQVLDEDPSNYNAHVFKALALLNLEQFDESEALYQKAIDLQPSQPLAWQGLEKFYTEREQRDKLVQVLQRQIEIAAEKDEVTRCAELVQRIVQIQRQHGSRSELVSALSVYLPSSRYHTILSELPAPDQGNPLATSTFDAQMAMHVDSLKILQEVIQLTEQTEKDTIEKETNKRKNRLDSMAKSREALHNEIGLEIWTTSTLPELYESVLSHVLANDETRREAEHKLLLYRLNVLKALPNTFANRTLQQTAVASDEKAEKREKEAAQRKADARKAVEEMAEGIVAINVPDEEAWKIVLEWHDALHLSDLNRQRLRAYISHFPRSGLSSSLSALLLTVKDQQFLKERAEALKESDTDTEALPQADPLTLALDGLEQSPDSFLAHRIVATLYLTDRDWTSASELATAGTSVARRLESQLGISLTMSKCHLESILAVSLTSLHPPQHHARATRLCDAILMLDARNIEALMCKASIAQAAQQWEQARSTLVNVQQVEREDVDKDNEQYAARRTLSPFANPGREARLDIAWCDVHLERLIEAEDELRNVIDEIEDDRTADATDCATAWWRLGRCLWKMGGEQRTGRQAAFSCFITALKKDATYAPAFTSLGFFYSTVAVPVDAQRASKCFQKAFELDARENEAARKLAETYAEEEDWDLVELVARRTIEAEGGGELLSQRGRDNAGKDATLERQRRRHTTQNAWAWNAIGSTELVRGNVEYAIVALQVALRSFSDRQDIWMRLGDAYVASGRHSAAIKTYQKAYSLQTEEEKWQAMFCIASVQRELGLFREALTLYDAIVRRQPTLLDLQVARAETRLALAKQDMRDGYAMRARSGIYRAVVEAKTVLAKEQNGKDGKNDSNSSAWKVVADGLVDLTRMGSSNDQMEIEFVQKVVRQIVTLASQKVGIDDEMPAVSSVTMPLVLDAIGSVVHETLSRAMYMTAAYLSKARILFMAPDDEMVGTAWMDLSMTLHACASSLAEDMHPEGSEMVDRINVMQSQAISCAKEALKLEPGNGSFWNHLGILVFSHGVALAQHCFIKATECDGGSKDVMAWTNLGLLYVANDDVHLAQACFVRAQTIDAEYVQAWIGQAIVADKQGEQAHCQSLYRHAYAIDQTNNAEAAYGYASATFAQLQRRAHKSNDDGQSTAHVRLALSALEAYLANKPNDVVALHLAALFAEQLGELDTAAERIERAASTLEKAYEANESRQTAQLFAICMANVGRIYLAARRYEEAIEKLNMCLGLLEENDGEEEGNSDDIKTLSSDDLIRARQSAHCGIALASYGLGETSKAIESLGQSLEEESSNAQDYDALTTLLAQMYWSAGRDGDAESLLMERIGSSSAVHSTTITTLLGALSWLTNNEEQVEAVYDDLVAQTTTQAVAFTSLLELYEGKMEQAINRLESRAEESSDINEMLVDATVRLAARGLGHEKPPPAPQYSSHEALRKSEKLYDAIAGGKTTTEKMHDDDDADCLTRALRYKSVAAGLSWQYDGGEDADEMQSSATIGAAPLPLLQVSRHAAVQALRRSPYSMTSWRTLAAVFGDGNEESD